MLHILYDTNLVIKILAIGDISHNFRILRKYVRKSKIRIINFPWDTASKITDNTENVEFFDSLKVLDQVKKINKIKNNFDLVLVLTWAGARVAYLADVNYIIFFIGSALRVPLFIKNPTLDYLEKPLPSLNFLERRFYKAVLDNAVACVAYGEDLFQILKKYRTKNISKIELPVDTTIFNENVKPIERKKSKFTFFSPQRIGRAKGFDTIWKAVALCKSNFEILQVEWYLGQRTPEEIEINKKFVENKPTQVKLIPIVKKDEIARYYAFADAILGQMRSGLGSFVEREAAFCKKPVIQYSDPKIKYMVDGKEISSPFLPHSTDPKELAELIDKIVESKKFREELAEKEYNFVKKIADPHIIAEKWEILFENLIQQFTSINKNSSTIRIKFRIIYFLLSNRLYVKKIKKILIK